MLEAETEVLEFRLDLVESQTVGQRCIDVEGLTGYLILLVGGLRLQCTHIMQTVANLDENDANVITHGEQQFLEVLGLCRCLLAEDSTRYLGQPVDNLRNLRAEHIADILDCIIGIFHHIVQQCRADAGRAKAHLLTGDLGYGDGMHDIWFARKTTHALMCLTGKVECLGNQVHFLSVG